LRVPSVRPSLPIAGAGREHRFLGFDSLANPLAHEVHAVPAVTAVEKEHFVDVEVVIVNAFVDGDEGGNPAGVVLDAQRFDPSQKLAIAARVGSSETAFVSPSRRADFKFEFFTPTRQIAHCGHATIAAFSYLHQLGRIAAAESSKETADGVRRIYLDGAAVFMEQSAPVYSEPGTRGVGLAPVLSSLRTPAQDLLEGFGPLVVSTGNAFLLVPLRDAAAVRGVEPDLDAVAAVSERLDLVGYYVFSPETVVPGRDAGARMFAPRYGIPEEPATGMGAGPLACFLRDRMGVRKDEMRIEQGRLMAPPSPSMLTVKLSGTGGKVSGVRAGGTAKVMRTIGVRL
jgi:PhzF family phenazine biosynthesis protein